MDAGRGVGVDRHLGLRRLRRFPVAILGEGLAHRGNLGRVGHREVVARLQRVLVALLDLAPDVQQERAVGGVDGAQCR
jgi:hypothetical protein